jgi:UDP-N-acetylmuramyl pentapeptide phosphotransferase/UDP-N-acetylglucosamine-1-phosphate transferase
MEVFVITVILLAVVVALLTVAGVFGLMQKDKRREGQSGSPTAGGEGAKQGRAAALD